MEKTSELFISRNTKDNFRCWTEINLFNLKNNIDIIKSFILSKAELICVLKDNFYGFCNINIIKYLSFIGIKYFAVTTLQKALELRKFDTQSEIIILNWTSVSKKDIIIQNNLTQTLFDYKYAKKFNKYPNKVKSLIKIDIGLDLLGFNMNQIKLIKECYTFKNLKIKGIFADLSLIQDYEKSGDISINILLKNFNLILQKLENEGINLGKKFIINSFGKQEMKNYIYDKLSGGLLMFGFSTDEYNKLINNSLLDNNFKPITSLRCKVMTIKYLKKGEKVGYNSKFIAKEKTKIATISIGYADGLNFCCSKNQLNVILRNKLCPLIGNICMDCSIIKIPIDLTINAEDVVTIFGYDNKGNYLNLDEFILKSDSTFEEIIARLSKRITRLYHL